MFMWHGFHSLDRHAGNVNEELQEPPRLEGQSMAARFLSRHRPTTVSLPLAQLRVGVPPKPLTMALGYTSTVTDLVEHQAGLARSSD
jgi:hypothetical protein